MRGLFVVVEGIDGAGKSTLMHSLQDLPGTRFTREPTHGPNGAAIRFAFAEGRRLSRKDERLLLETDRKDHVATLIRPALARGETVICDRSYYSTAAYQGADADDARAIVRHNETFAPRPDAVIFLDLPPVFALARVQARGAAPTAPETYEALRDCAARYEAVWQDADLMRGIWFARLDARQPTNELASRARDFVTTLLAVRRDAPGAHAA